MRPLSVLILVAILIAMLGVTRMMGLPGGGGSGAAQSGSRTDEVRSNVNKSLEKARDRLTQGIDQAGAE